MNIKGTVLWGLLLLWGWNIHASETENKINCEKADISQQVFSCLSWTLKNTFCQRVYGAENTVLTNWWTMSVFIEKDTTTPSATKNVVPGNGGLIEFAQTYKSAILTYELEFKKLSSSFFWFFKKQENFKWKTIDTFDFAQKWGKVGLWFYWWNAPTGWKNQHNGFSIRLMFREWWRAKAYMYYPNNQKKFWEYIDLGMNFIPGEKYNIYLELEKKGNIWNVTIKINNQETSFSRNIWEFDIAGIISSTFRGWQSSAWASNVNNLVMYSNIFLETCDQ